MIRDKAGTLQDTPEGIEKAFLELYEDLLDSETRNRTHVNSALIRKGQVVPLEDRQWLCKTLDKTEVKEAMWQIGDDKAPGPDGYTSQFYKDNWDLIGRDVCEAVLDFLNIGKVLTQINATTITLVPKIKNPENVSEFRPIAYCTTIYKCISKMLCNRLKKVLPGIIDEAQCAFVDGRSIIQNVLMCQELTRGFNRKGVRRNAS